MKIKLSDKAVKENINYIFNLFGIKLKRDTEEDLAIELLGFRNACISINQWNNGFELMFNTICLFNDDCSGTV